MTATSPLVFSRLPYDGDPPITGTFGDTRAEGGWSAANPHRGLDVGVSMRQPIYAPADGTVVGFINGLTMWNGQLVPAFGSEAVCLDHVGTPYYSLYAHLDQNVVVLGQLVKAGDLLGYAGMKGVATGVHLHWQVCTSSAFPTDISFSRDPLSFVQQEDDVELTQRVERLERLFAGNGIDTPDGQRLTGEAALAWADAQGLSVLLAEQHDEGELNAQGERIKTIEDET